tara:strand:+ start:167 stop:424 length:258 start_codon:yes stop_codon:yes gene_type:complete
MDNSLDLKIIKIIADELRLDYSQLTLETKPYDIVEWDSLKNTLIFLLIEQQFSPGLTFDEYSSCHNIGELIGYIKSNKNKPNHRT